MSNFAHLGKALALLRLRANLSQRDVELACEVGQSNQSKYEKGATAPTIPILERLLSAYGADVQDLIDAMKAAEKGAKAMPHERSGTNPPAQVVLLPSQPDLDQRFAELEERLLSTVMDAVRPKRAPSRKPRSGQTGKKRDSRNE